MEGPPIGQPARRDLRGAGGIGIYGVMAYTVTQHPAVTLRDE